MRVRPSGWRTSRNDRCARRARAFEEPAERRLRTVVCGEDRIAGDGLAAGRRDVDDGNGVAARITRGIRIHAEQGDQTHVEARFLPRFAHRGMLYGLPNVDEAARQGMAERRTGAQD